MRQTNKESFDKKFMILQSITSTECWLWFGGMFLRRRAKQKDRVIPYFWITNQKGLYEKVYARRWAWEQKYGKIPDGAQIKNVCGDDRCVRPDKQHNSLYEPMQNTDSRSILREKTREEFESARRPRNEEEFLRDK